MLSAPPSCLPLTLARPPRSGVEVEVRPSRLGLARVSVLRGQGPAKGTPCVDDYIRSAEPVYDHLTKYRWVWWVVGWYVWVCMGVCMGTGPGNWEGGCMAASKYDRLAAEWAASCGLPLFDGVVGAAGSGARLRARPGLPTHPDWQPNPPPPHLALLTAAWCLVTWTPRGPRTT